MDNLENPQTWTRMFNNGLAKFYILKILGEKPQHGYGILKELSLLTQGCCTYTLGTIYPILANLTKNGYTKVYKIVREGKRERKIYSLTPKGKKAYKIALESWSLAIEVLIQAIGDKNLTTRSKNICFNKGK